MVSLFSKKKKDIPEVPKKINELSKSVSQTNENVCKVIVQSVVCPCNGKTYKNLKQHQATNVHKNWELPQKVKDLEILATRLTAENDHLKRLNVILTNELFNLKN
jgi:hypothetical protein